MSDIGAELTDTSVTLSTGISQAASVAARDDRITRAFEAQRSARRSKRGTTSWTQVSLVTDVAMLVVAGLIAEVTARDPGTPIVWTVVFSLLTVAFLNTRGMYRPPLQIQPIEMVRAVVIACGLATAIVVTLRVSLTDSQFIASQSIRIWLLATILLVASRISLALSERRIRRVGEAGRATLIVGAGKVGRLVAARLLQHPEFGLTPVGFLDKAPLYSSEELLDLPVLGASWDFEQIAEEHGIEHVVVTFSTAPTDVLLRLLRRSDELGIGNSFVPRLYEKSTERLTVQRLGGLPLVSTYSPDPWGWLFAVKYTTDRVVAAASLMLLAPVLAAFAGAVWISMGRPILYRQERVGRDGKRFQMLKFRSMRSPVDQVTPEVVVATDTAPGGVEGADRRTRLGSLLRRTSLDELPQLINVVRGDMSFVGPRPERPEFVEIFERDVHRYAERHRVKSGITGWAQVNGLRGKTSLADRVEWDNYYIENWTLWLDFKILLMTLAVVVRSRDVE